MEIKFNVKGLIVNSDNPKEKFVKIIDDKENTGGFVYIRDWDFFISLCIR